MTGVERARTLPCKRSIWASALDPSHHCRLQKEKRKLMISHLCSNVQRLADFMSGEAALDPLPSRHLMVSCHISPQTMADKRNQWHWALIGETHPADRSICAKRKGGRWRLGGSEEDSEEEIRRGMAREEGGLETHQ